MKYINGTILEAPFFTKAAAYEIKSDLAFKRRKNLIRSNPSSRSHCVMIISLGTECCEMKDLNGPNFRNNSRVTLSFMLKATRKVRAGTL
jgi:hypothetical protein